MHRNTYTIGIDIGGTKIAFALIDSEGTVREDKKIPTNLSGGTEFIQNEIGKQVNSFIKKYGSSIMGIGLATPGYIDPVAGIVKNAVNLNWKDVHVVDILKNSIEMPLPIYLQRDTVAETLGEYYFGAGKNCQNFVFLGIGTGFGAGAVTSGHLLTGFHNMALEIGHLSVDEKGPPCACGNVGCIETILSGKGLVNRAKELFNASHDPVYVRMKDSITARQVLRMAKAHDPMAEELMEKMAKSLGFICAVLKSVIDPERFIIGGGLGKAIFNKLTDAVEKEMNARVFKMDDQPTHFYKSSLKTSAMGAGAMVWYFNNILPNSLKNKNE